MRTEIDSYIPQFLAFVKTLPLDFKRELNYTNPVLILADAVLSMNRKYKTFVIPRIELLRKAGITSLTQLNNLITQEGIEEFTKVWNYNDPKRVKILQSLAEKFLKLKEQYGLADDLETLHKWGIETESEVWTSFGIKGIGFVTYQYLRILCGASTVKPDIWIERVFVEAVGKSRPLGEIIEVVKETAKQMNMPAQQLDNALWRYYSERAK